MLSFFELMALLLFLSAGFSWINAVYLRLPQTIGLLIIALASSLLILAGEVLFPDIGIAYELQRTISQIDFNETLMNGMLAFLLFAGALHVNMTLLKAEGWAIGSMATLGVVISTIIVGFSTYWVMALFGVDLPLIWAFVFGALISPTDPVAVLSILRTVNMPESLKALISGESLFNDGVGVVVFSIMVTLAMSTMGGAHGAEAHITAGHIIELFAVEAIGGGVLGLICGYIAYHAMTRVDDYIVETLITLALVTVTYTIASRINILGHHLSGPIAVVIAGLMIGNQGAEHAMSSHTQTYLFSFWEMIDEILNAVLFLLIGLELLVVGFSPRFVWITFVIIPLVLFARVMAVSTPMLFIKRFIKPYPKGTIPVLVWGGVRGGISVALALSLPDTEYKAGILAVTYGVVIFSIIVQGLSIKKVVERSLDVESVPEHPGPI